LEIQFEAHADAADFLAAEVGPLTGGVEIRDTGTLLSAADGRCIVVALCSPDDRGQVLAAAQDGLDNAKADGIDVDPVCIRERLADETEWRDIWKQFFRATRVSPRFTVRPSWDPGDAPEGEFVIDLDPGRAFGTGAHPSTRLVIALSELVAQTSPTLDRFLDLGCGSGILAIAASRLWPNAKGLAVDNDPEATDCSAENFERNKVTTVQILTGTLDVAEPRQELILANIQADVLCAIAGQMKEKISPAGTVILSGILTDQVDEVVAAYAEAGFVLSKRQDEAEWAGLLLLPAPTGA
jgi:ribosomal protein L11 methyltransferase